MATSTSNSTSKTALSATIFPAQVTPGQSAQVAVIGGRAPYVYTLASGSAAASVDSGGLITGTTTAGTVMIAIVDADSRSAFATLIVAQTATVTVTNTNCQTPWGTTIETGASITGFATGSVACPTTCTPATVTCTNGVLSGTATAANCAVNSCVYKLSTAGLCPNSGNLTSIVTTTPAPPTCAASQYHIYYCATMGRSGSEYHCVSPSETP